MEMVREKGSEESEGTSGEKFGKTRIESLDSDQTRVDHVMYSGEIYIVS
jgi:hypothetical protein